MIIDFTITNFRSIRDEQTLSMHAQGGSVLENNVSFPADEKIGVLRSVGIYGANASGKSNFLLALRALQFIVCNTGNLQDGARIACYEPYLLSSETKNAPVIFEVEFYLNKVRFLYRVAYSSVAIIEESLDYYPSRHKANLFNRSEGDTWESISFGSHLKGGRRKYALFGNNSYLAKAGNSADAPQIIRDVFNFFNYSMKHLAVGEDFKISKVLESESVLAAFATILNKVDTGISNIEVEDQEEKLLKSLKGTPEDIKEEILKRSRFKPFFLHKNNDGGFERFTEHMESSGTLKLFDLLPLLISCFHQGSILIIDELDNSLHFHMAELIIKLFHDPLVNKNNSQLIFSTHNINLMSNELMRRDQIWFCEKDFGVSSIASLDQFDKKVVKSDSPFVKWYEEGRFGGIPNIDYLAVADILSFRED